MAGKMKISNDVYAIGVGIALIAVSGMTGTYSSAVMVVGAVIGALGVKATVFPSK
jgi:hypothetical protein